ncbi:hypothetical protein FRZ00_33410 [Streptomyces mobaraensis]|uniref:DUF4913 domain-containing protein n=2 Tax=Streptomyces mobaraensis TaxID=35621 RepID=A0A5N5VXJ1_STRMB|nr:hypothetical protein FRZ00_33410 [Streptomyces mobaraensis]
MEMLLRLTGDLSDVRGRVQDLEDQGVAATLESLDTKVGGLKETLAAVVEAIQQLQAEPEEEEEEEPDWPGTTPNWTDDLDQDQARELWDGLTEWCQNKLWPIYVQDVWKPCWYRHMRLRVELTWVWRAYEWSYEKGKGVPPTRVAEWHVRWVKHIEAVLKEELKECGLPRDGLPRPKHRVPLPQPPTEEDETPAPPPFRVTDFVDPTFFEWVEDNIRKRRPAENSEDEKAG